MDTRMPTADDSAPEVAGVPGAAMYRAQARQLARTLPGQDARRELRRDYNRIVYAKNVWFDARKAYDAARRQVDASHTDRRPKPGRRPVISC